MLFSIEKQKLARKILFIFNILMKGNAEGNDGGSGLINPRFDLLPAQALP
jgi:hypothetical protein